jgi:Fe2+ transport system protein FeoA
MGGRNYISDGRHMVSLKEKEKTVSLDTAVSGQSLKIFSLPEGVLHAQFVRLGFHEGQRVRCLERLPGGTVILQKNRQQIAVGYSLAKCIIVIPTEEKPA